MKRGRGRGEERAWGFLVPFPLLFPPLLYFLFSFPHLKPPDQTSRTRAKNGKKTPNGATKKNGQASAEEGGAHTYTSTHENTPHTPRSASSTPPRPPSAPLAPLYSPRSTTRPSSRRVAGAQRGSRPAPLCLLAGKKERAGFAVGSRWRCRAGRRWERGWCGGWGGRGCGGGRRVRRGCRGFG